MSLCECDFQLNCNQVRDFFFFFLMRMKAYPTVIRVYSWFFAKGPQSWWEWGGGTICDATDQTRVGHMQGKYLIRAQSLWPSCWGFCLVPQAADIDSGHP